MKSARIEPPAPGVSLAAPADRARVFEDEEPRPSQRSVDPSSFSALAWSAPARVGAAFEALPHPVVLVWADGSDLVLNAAAREAFGIASGERLRDPSALIERLQAGTSAEADRPTAESEADPESALTRALAGDATGRQLLQFRRDDELRTWIVDAQPVREAGLVCGAVAIFRDASEQTLDEEMADDLLGRAAHDLRTPLTALKASAQLVSRGFDRLDAAARARTLGLLLAQIDKLAARIDDVLDAARIRRGRFDLAPEVVDLGALLPEIVQSIESRPGAARCMLAGLDGPEPIHVHTDRARLRQILGELANEIVERHGPRAEIRIEVRPTIESVELVVMPVRPPESGARTDGSGRKKATGRRLAAAILARLGGGARTTGDETRSVILDLPRRTR
jgi:signal transduction histidine kinase